MPVESKDTSFQKLATIEIKPFELGQKYEFASTEFLLSNRQSIGKYYAFNLSDIIDPHLKDLSIEKRSNVIIIAENNDGKTQPFSYTDCSFQYSMIPGLLTFTKRVVGIPDTLDIGQDINDETGLEIEKVEEFFQVLTKRRLYLQLKYISEEEKAEIFKTTSIMFPVDKSTKRWLTDIKELHIYYYGELEKE